jgi:CO dehydrogenase/acetyl-CoA synthase epsilon subunit
MMKTHFASILVLFFSVQLLFSQNVIVSGRVGIGSTTPQGQLDVKSTNLGLVVPRVSDIKLVTDGSGNLPVDGTIVYDSLREAMMFRIDGQWLSLSIDNEGNAYFGDLTNYIQSYTYVKASNTGANDWFGYSCAMNADGSVMVVGAHQEDSNATGINGDQSNNSAANSGAVYVFVRNGTMWTQQAYIKASNAEAGDEFGRSVSINADGNTIAVSAPLEDSNAIGINGDQSNNGLPNAGAVYVYVRNGSVWSQQAYIKQPYFLSDDQFGNQLDLSGDGQTLAIGAFHNLGKGIVFICSRTGSTWSHQTSILGTNTEVGDDFGASVSISGDGKYLAVGATGEDSNATGINGDQDDDTFLQSGATYLFSRSGSSWTQEAYIKASNTAIDDQFGSSVSLNGDGTVLAVGAKFEDSNATGINGDQANNASANSGAVYIFEKPFYFWSQQVYMKASNTGNNDQFGGMIMLNDAGNRLVIGAANEDSSSPLMNGSQTSNSAPDAGAVYDFRYSGTKWVQHNYIKASTPGSPDSFGISAGMSGTGDILVIGAYREESNATGIDGDQSNDLALGSGAVYIIK